MVSPFHVPTARISSARSILRTTKMPMAFIDACDGHRSQKFLCLVKRPITKSFSGRLWSITMASPSIQTCRIQVGSTPLGLVHPVPQWIQGQQDVTLLLHSDLKGVLKKENRLESILALFAGRLKTQIGGIPTTCATFRTMYIYIYLYL